MTDTESVAYTVFIDSTCLKMNFRPMYGAWQTLEWLVAEKLLRLCTSHVNYGEHLSWLRLEHAKLGDQCLSLFKQFDRQLGVKSDSVTTYVSSHVKDVYQKAEDKFLEWLKRCEVEVLKNSSEDVALVFEDYFSGSGSFSTVKNRNDLPDAFIFSSIIKLDASSTIVVTADNSLGAALAIQGYKVCVSIDKLMEEDAIQALQNRISGRSLLYLSTHQKQNLETSIADYVRNSSDKFLNESVSIIAFDSAATDELLVPFAGDLLDLKLSMDTVKYSGKDQFSIECAAKFEAGGTLLRKDFNYLGKAMYIPLTKIIEVEVSLKFTLRVLENEIKDDLSNLTFKIDIPNPEEDIVALKNEVLIYEANFPIPARVDETDIDYFSRVGTARINFAERVNLLLKNKITTVNNNASDAVFNEKLHLELAELKLRILQMKKQVRENQRDLVSLDEEISELNRRIAEDGEISMYMHLHVSWLNKRKGHLMSSLKDIEVDLPKLESSVKEKTMSIRALE